MLYVVLATFAAGMATEYFLGNRWIGFFAVGVPACLYFFYLDYQKRAAAKKEEEEKAEAGLNNLSSDGITLEKKDEEAVLKAALEAYIK